MKKYTIGVFAHANAGKTTLTEHLLLKAGVISFVGRVDHGNTVTDNLMIEKDRGITVRSSLISFKSNNNLFYLIDTPGHIDFVSEVQRAISILDIAILVISGVEKVEAQTYDIFKTLIANKIPTILFVNKLDRAGANLDETLNDLRKEFNCNFIKANELSDDNKKVNYLDKEYICNKLAIFDDSLLEDYLNNSLSNEKIISSFNNNFENCKFYPVFCGSALNDIGISELFDFLGNIKKEIQYSNETSAFVYQVRIDNTTQNAYVKNYGKTIFSKEVITLSDETIKLDNIFIPNGNEEQKISQLESGDVAIIKGLNLESGTWIGKEVKQTNLIFQKPLYSISISPENSDDKIKLANALKILNKEDPNLNLQFNNLLQALQIDIMGKMQAEIIQQFILERFNIKTNISNLSLIFKETPKDVGIGACSYTSTSAVEFQITPLPTGSGIKYINSQFAKGNILPKYLKQVERLVQENLKNTPLGWELTDAEIMLKSGRYDSVCSEPMHYNICTPIAFMRALNDCGTKLLEPINEVKITANIEQKNSLLNYLSRNNIAILNFETNEQQCVAYCEILASICTNLGIDLIKECNGLVKVYSKFKAYVPCRTIIENQYRSYDTRNETKFVQTFMNANIKLLDKEKKKKRKIKFSQRRYDKDDI